MSETTALLLSRSKNLFFATTAKEHTDFSVERGRKYYISCIKRGTQKNEHNQMMELYHADDYQRILITNKSKYDVIADCESAGMRTANTQKQSQLKK
ncbi:hypothetical protein [Photobacterium chitinilyticum]|uniref:Uncharacterized protein n=1 Tax=Photobacterium chitinilyticum TaxID=2485123 RepID=A0A444JIH9_9GAMM|nr:hypothetical protein [Photobacterium chitinilyticum]RWX52879.1 hypothetical protein EDI28_24775 [Photobacterium chitinilyticum]